MSGVGNVCSRVIACFLLKFPCQTLSLFSLSLASYSACPPAGEAAWVLLVFLVVGIVGIDYAAWCPAPLPPAQAGCQAALTHQLQDVGL